MTRLPFVNISALKLAGPSAHPRMVRSRSSSVKSNIRRYSSNDLPQGTASLYLNAIVQENNLQRFGFQSKRKKSDGMLGRHVLLFSMTSGMKLENLPIFEMSEQS